MPLPCSPVSMSTGEDTSVSQCSEDELITPRPGPSATDQRTQDNLSRPAQPSPEAFKRPNTFKEWSTDNIRERPETEDDEIEQAIERAHSNPDLLPWSSNRAGKSLSLDTTQHKQTAPTQQLSAIFTVASTPPSRLRRASAASDRSGKSHRSRSGSSSSQKLPGQNRKYSKRSSSSTTSSSQKPGETEKQRSVSFHPSSFKMASPAEYPVSPGTTTYKDFLSAKKSSPRSSLFDKRLTEETESSADENTAIFRRRNSAKTGVGTTTYGSNAPSTLRLSRTDEPGTQQADGYDGAAEDGPSSSRRSKPSSPTSARSGPPGSNAATAAADGQRAHSTSEGRDKDGAAKESWWRTKLDKYGSIELENKGSVARDHLALERTFLAWLRTSLSFASIGIAVTQLFRLNSALRSDDKNASNHSTGGADGVIVSTSADGSRIHESPFLTAIATAPELRRLGHIGKPLGATFLGVAVLILLVGFHRYFESQHYVIRGKFPASRGSVVLVSAVAGALIIASLVVILWIAPDALAGT